MSQLAELELLSCIRECKQVHWQRGKLLQAVASSWGFTRKGEHLPMLR